MGAVDLSYFGQASFEEPETIEITSPGDPTTKITAQCSQGEWRPPTRLASFLPPEFAIPLTCYSGSDGIRRIVPGGTFEQLIYEGARGGLAVLQGIHGFDKEVDHSYRAMFLIHQYVRGRVYRNRHGMREHLMREFRSSRDLHVRQSGRIVDSERDVLPSDLGRLAPDEGRPCSVSTLTKIGRDAAVQDGIVNPTSQYAISYGLYEAARRTPLTVADQEVPALIRSALFDNVHGDLPDELIGYVEERLVTALHGHLLDSSEDFEKWFFSADNSLVKQLAKQKKPAGGRLDEDDVRRVLLELGWLAYAYVGPCVHALMRTIKNSIPELDEQEQCLFEHMHERQAYYGGFPACLLAERMTFLRRGVLAIWNAPGDDMHVRVLHRLLSYYAEMARTRRAADLQSKQKCGASGENETARDGHDEVTDAFEVGFSGPHPMSLGPPTQAGVVIGSIEDASAPQSAHQLFNDVVDHLRELNGIKCPNRCGVWGYQLVDLMAQTLTIDIRCECQQVAQAIRLPREMFENVARWILEP